MRELQLDYQRKASNITLLGAAICIVAVGVLALSMFQYRRLNVESEVLEIKLRQLEHNSSSRFDAASSRQDERALAREMKEANQVLKMMGLRWDSIFGAVAAAHGNGVALLAMAPEPDKGIVRISAEAKNFSLMLDYVKRLEDQPALGEVYLQSHNLQKQDPQKPVRFVVVADWLEN